VVSDEVVGAVLNPFGSGGVGRASIGRVVFEAAVFRRVMRWGNNDAVGAVEFGVLVMGEDSVGEDGGGSVAETLVDHDFDVVGGEDFEGGGEGGLGKGVGIFGKKEWAESVLRGAVIDDGLGDGGDVVVVKGCMEGAAAMTGGPERNALGGNGWIGMERVKG